MSEKEEFNIRAAEALGFKCVYNESWHANPGFVGVRIPKKFWKALALESYERREPCWQPGFDTSYDWAMLGVKELVTRHFNNDPVLVAKYNILPMLPIDWMTARPEQITQAWLTILEKPNDQTS